MSQVKLRPIWDVTGHNYCCYVTSQVKIITDLWRHKWYHGRYLRLQVIIKTDCWRPMWCHSPVIIIADIWRHVSLLKLMDITGHITADLCNLICHFTVDLWRHFYHLLWYQGSPPATLLSVNHLGFLRFNVAQYGTKWYYNIVHMHYEWAEQRDSVGHTKLVVQDQEPGPCGWLANLLSVLYLRIVKAG